MVSIDSCAGSVASRVEPSGIASNELYVVGIGVTNHCVRHLESFIKELPVNTGLSYVLVQPVLQDNKGIMIELMGKFDSDRIVEIKDGVEIEPNHFYHIQPDMTPLIEGNRFKVLPDTSNRETLHHVDCFLCSLAENFRENAISILLSDNSTDGAQGCNAIKANGGMIMINDQSCSPCDTPCDAFKTDLFDYIIPPREMPEHLLRYVNQRRGIHGIVDESDRKRGINWFTRVMEILLDHEGIDFSHYKPKFIERKIERHMSMCHCKTMEQYVEHLQESSAEVRLLRKDFLMTTTRFFRDYGAFDYLENEVLPAIFESKSEKEPIRVWVIGCSTGEEAYSLGILLLEAMQDKSRDVMLYATDLDEDALNLARKGTYPEGIFADVDEDYLLTYFVDEDGCFSVGEELRNLVMFQKHNVITQFPIQDIDLIACRYLMRTLKHDTRKKLLTKLNDSLKPSGFLVLGSGESAGDEGDLFETVDATWKVFKPVERQHEEEPVEETETDPHYKPPGMEVLGRQLLKAIITETQPPSVLVDQDGRLISTWNGGKRYFGHAKNGDPPYLVEIIDEPLKETLKALQKTCEIEGKKAHGSIEYQGKLLRMTGTPIAFPSLENPLYLITFKEIVTHG